MEDIVDDVVVQFDDELGMVPALLRGPLQAHYVFVAQIAIVLDEVALDKIPEALLFAGQLLLADETLSRGQGGQQEDPLQAHLGQLALGNRLTVGRSQGIVSSIRGDYQNGCGGGGVMGL